MQGQADTHNRTHSHTDTQNGLRMCWHKDILPSAWAFSSKLGVRAEHIASTRWEQLKDWIAFFLKLANAQTHIQPKKKKNLNTHLCTCCISFSLSFTFSWRFPTALAKHHLSLPRSLPEERWRAQKRADEGGKEGGSNGDVFQLGWFMAGCCHYFTIYWRNQAGQLKLCGGAGGHQGWRKHAEGGVTHIQTVCT